ncbi:MAG: DNA repair protein RecN [Chitinophagia bacterium]
MLTHLDIQNYILIDELQINLSNQLSVITGETGAGKSIIMGALGLILGDRADSTVCRNPEKKCVIEGTFTLANKNHYTTFFEANDLDLADELIIRREIGAQGKSRAFINDTPINLTELRQLTSQLVDLHQQFDTLSLGDMEFQRTVLDALANVHMDLEAYQTTFFDWKAATKHLSELIEQKENFDQTVAYKSHLLEELTALDLQENELEQLESDLKFMEHAADIKVQLTKSIHALDESDQPILQQIKQIANNLESISKFQIDFAPLLERLKAAQIELSDVTSELQTWQDKMDIDASKISTMQERLSQGYHLQKKHKVQSTAELLELQLALSKDLEAVLHIDEAIETYTKKVATSEKALSTLADSLSNKRNKQAAPFAKQVNHLLHQVGMPNAQLKVQLDKVPFNSFGIDKIDFLFDANNSQKFEPIKKVASGGELSRLMLCIKSLVGKSIDLPTMIFDEIDSGISGEPAKQVGLLLQELGQARQVLCITHQPQIAAKGQAHLYVYKNQEGKTTHTHVRTLAAEERVVHIARMIGGDPPSKAALEHAHELLA